MHLGVGRPFYREYHELVLTRIFRSLLKTFMWLLCHCAQWRSGSGKKNSYSMCQQRQKTPWRSHARDSIWIYSVFIGSVDLVRACSTMIYSLGKQCRMMVAVGRGGDMRLFHFHFPFWLVWFWSNSREITLYTQNAGCERLVQRFFSWSPAMRWTMVPAWRIVATWSALQLGDERRAVQIIESTWLWYFFWWISVAKGPESPANEFGREPDIGLIFECFLPCQISFPNFTSIFTFFPLNWTHDLYHEQRHKESRQGRK